MLDEIKVLSKEILKANKAYYNTDKPIMSDSVFDSKKDKLLKLINSFKAKDSIEQTIINNALIVLNGIGAEPVSSWEKVIHSVPMGSLNKINSTDELIKWHDNPKNLLFLTEKLDGISIDTQWQDGLLVKAVTRGDGQTGEDISINVKKMIGIPKSLPNKFTGNVRGEIVLTKSVRDKHLPGYTALRNAACGLAKRFDGFGSEHLTVIMYKVEGKDFDSETSQFKWIKDAGFIVPNYFSNLTTDKVVEKYKEYISKKRDLLDYDIDGLVVRINNLSEQIALGSTHDRPKGAIAFKFDAAGAETVCRNIVWQVGNSGRITPVAEFDKIELLGAKIKRASLYNFSYVKEINISVGASILVTRANDVIPRVEEVIKPTKTAPSFPEKCPECSAATFFNGEYLICPNKNDCPPQIAGRLKTWVSELNILEWGKTILEKLAAEKLATDIDQLYALTVEDLSKVDRLGDKSAQNLVDSLNNHREINLANLIGGLGIEGIATSTTKLIIEKGYDTLDKMYLLSESDLEKIDGFGTIRARAFVKGLKENKKRIDNILKQKVTIKSKTIGCLTGKSFCFTGAMSTPRNSLHALVEANGGSVKKSVGKGLSYLVMDNPDASTSKAKAALKLNISLLSEKDFLKMIEK